VVIDLRLPEVLDAVMLGVASLNLLIVREIVEVAVAPAASVTVKTKLKVPVTVGVPESTPAVLKLIPVGTPVAAQVFGLVPPVADMVTLV
jgi:hypothetical protein